MNSRKIDVRNKSNVEVSSDGLEIKMTSRDEGEYHCTATNSNGKAMSASVKLIAASMLLVAR